jgi:RNA recognition motif-containing protein
MDEKTETTTVSNKHTVVASSNETPEASESVSSPAEMPNTDATETNAVDAQLPSSATDTDSPGDDERKRRVYVGNLAWSVSWQDLKDLMKSTGHEVTRADIMMTPDGRSKGCGIVEFATSEGAAEAVSTFNDVELNGRQIFVREDREDRSGGGNSGGQKYNRSNYEHRPRPNQPSHQQSGNRGGGPSNSANNSSSSDAQSRRVYVGNLSWDVTWQELKEHMRSAGEVVFAEIITENNGRSKGCGIVHYATEAEAQQAISTLLHTELKGRTIFVREDREGNPGGSSGHAGGSGKGQNYPGNTNASVYVWNLSYDTSWQDLKDHMRKAGNVDQATILTDDDGSSIGCGVVVYQKHQDAQRAIRELQDSELNGRPLKLREDRVGGRSGRGGGGRHGGRSGRFGGRGGRYGGSDHHQQGGAGSGGSETVPEGTQLFVSNLPFEANWRDLKEHFSTAGEVHRAFIKVSDTGRSKGIGVVRFLKKEDAENAIATLNGVEFQGRPLDVRFDNKA